MLSVLIEKIDQFITKHDLIPTNTKIVLGFSGGPDSVFLFHFLADKYHKGTISLTAAHLDHEWRSNSYKDEQFCRKMASELNVPYTSAKSSELGVTEKFNGSLEEFNRKIRRHFLKAVRKHYNADRIALAHHLQDQQETFFIRLIRGAALTGLTAMRPKHGKYIRTLLEVNKIDIINYLDKNNVEYLVDPSNESPKFLRNRIRNTVLPALQACDQRFDANFLMTLSRLKNTEQFLERLTEKTFDQVSYVENNIVYFDLKLFFALDPVMQYRLIMYWLEHASVPFPPTQKFLDEIRRFLKQPGSKEHQIHKLWSLVKKKELVHIHK